MKVRGLYALADTAYLAPTRLVPAVAAALQGGARLVQYRDKGGPAAQPRREAEALRQLCRAWGALFLINDDVALARAVAADGVHLGRGDTAIEDARAVCGPGALIGVSCYNELARGQDAADRGADYVAFGSFFASRTKPQAVRAEVALLAAARARLELPLVAIGGITPENGASLIAAGADAVAVISGLWEQPDIEAAARRYAALFND